MKRRAAGDRQASAAAGPLPPNDLETFARTFFASSPAPPALAQGISHEVHIVQSAHGPLALRRAKLSGSYRECLTRALQTQEIVSSLPSGLAPEMLAVVADAETRLVVGISRAVEGRSPVTGADLLRGAETLAKLHRATMGDDGGQYDLQKKLIRDTKQHLRRARSLDAEHSSLAFIDESLASCHSEGATSGAVCLCHGDLCPENIILLAGPGAESLLVDWDDAERAPPELDVAHIIAPTTTQWATRPFSLSSSEREAFVRLYNRYSNYPVCYDTLRAMIPLVVLRCLAWCVAIELQAKAGQRTLRPEIGNRLARFTGRRSMQGFLAEAHAL